MDKKQTRYHYIDLLKGICIILVLINHLPWEKRRNYVFPFIIETAVPLFMMVSGWISAKNYKKKNFMTLSDCYHSSGMIKSIINYSVPLMTLAAAQMVILYVFQNRAYDIINILVLGRLGPGNYYFPCLLQLVVIFPIIYIITLKYNESGLVFFLFLNILYEFIQVNYELDAGTYRLLVFRYIFCIAFGCYISLNEDKKFKWYIGLGGVVIGVGWIYAIRYLGYQSKYFSSWPLTNVFAALYIAVVFKLFIGIFKKIHIPLLEYIGKNSYYIFLIQMSLFTFNIDEHADRLFKNNLLEFIFIVVICICSGLAYSLLIKPITRWFAEKFLMLFNRIKKKLNISGFLLKNESGQSNR